MQEEEENVTEKPDFDTFTALYLSEAFEIYSLQKIQRVFGRDVEREIFSFMHDASCEKDGTNKGFVAKCRFCNVVEKKEVIKDDDSKTIKRMKEAFDKLNVLELQYSETEREDNTKRIESNFFKMKHKNFEEPLKVNMSDAFSFDSNGNLVTGHLLGKNKIKDYNIEVEFDNTFQYISEEGICGQNKKDKFGNLNNFGNGINFSAIKSDVINGGKELKGRFLFINDLFYLPYKEGILNNFEIDEKLLQKLKHSCKYKLYSFNREMKLDNYLCLKYENGVIYAVDKNYNKVLKFDNEKAKWVNLIKELEIIDTNIDNINDVIIDKDLNFFENFTKDNKNSSNNAFIANKVLQEDIKVNVGDKEVVIPKNTETKLTSYSKDLSLQAKLEFASLKKDNEINLFNFDKFDLTIYNKDFYTIKDNTNGIEYTSKNDFKQLSLHCEHRDDIHICNGDDEQEIKSIKDKIKNDTKIDKKTKEIFIKKIDEFCFYFCGKKIIKNQFLVNQLPQKVVNDFKAQLKKQFPIGHYVIDYKKVKDKISSLKRNKEGCTPESILYNLIKERQKNINRQ